MFAYGLTSPSPGAFGQHSSRIRIPLAHSATSAASLPLMPCAGCHARGTSLFKDRPMSILPPSD
jgi:hypothetical protein